LKRAPEKLKRYYERAPIPGDHACYLLRHTGIAASRRDELGMVVYPGEAGATVTRGCAGLRARPMRLTR